MMEYRETKPDKTLLTHVESFWEINTNDQTSSFTKVLIVPEAVFDILFVAKSLFIYNLKNKNYSKLFPGVYFLGLFTESHMLLIPDNTDIFGIRLKPFSLTKITAAPLYKFRDSMVKLENIFGFIKKNEVDVIINTKEYDQRIEYARAFIARIIEKNQNIDLTLRDQLNYLMDSYGSARISSLYSAFYTNKTSLRNHFLSRVGLSPKELARIWRMNYFLQLRLENSSENLTCTGLDAGYFDQAHLIKDFKTFFFTSPLQFMNCQEPEELKIIQERIKRRLTSFYSPL